MLEWIGKRYVRMQKVRHEGSGFSLQEEGGFTLIEILVVIIIIGILAAIAIPVFLDQRENAWAAAAASELRNMAAAATSCSADNDGSYVNCDVADLEDYGWSNDSEVDQDVTLNTADDWAATTSHVNFGACDYTFTTEQADLNSGKVMAGAGC